MQRFGLYSTFCSDLALLLFNSLDQAFLPSYILIEKNVSPLKLVLSKGMSPYFLKHDHPAVNASSFTVMLYEVHLTHLS